MLKTRLTEWYFTECYTSWNIMLYYVWMWLQTSTCFKSKWCLFSPTKSLESKPLLEAYALTNHHHWSTLHLFPHYSLTDLSSASGFLPVHHTVCYVSIHFLKGTWPELVGICGTDWAQQFFRFKAASQIKSSRVYLLRSGDSVKQSPGVAVCLFQRMEQWDTVVD